MKHIHLGVMVVQKEDICDEKTITFGPLLNTSKK